MGTIKKEKTVHRESEEIKRKKKVKNAEVLFQTHIKREKRDVRVSASKLLRERKR